MANGFFQKPKGSIMFSAVLLVFLFSMLLLTALENHRLAVTFAIRTKKLYIAKTIKEMFWYEYEQQENPPEKGVVTFNVGAVRYQTTAGNLLIWIDHGGGTFYFEESLKKDTDKTVLEND
ncbi:MULTISPECIES: competence type IV pilus minor pilin ComGG [Enterococcus]|uniref:competence type IV pilus minor pilin ComGG n=1 Tax=Enterococcus TaxID=1350 RepID=UPI0010F6500F|nr:MULTISPECIES: competence type IV pilus minor pilin ComGG [Enterococcus]KAF1301609.1 hypothetical protein BAU16_08775 [Enterococcus sp. JM9B]